MVFLILAFSSSFLRRFSCFWSSRYFSTSAKSPLMTSIGDSANVFWSSWRHCGLVVMRNLEEPLREIAERVEQSSFRSPSSSPVFRNSSYASMRIKFGDDEYSLSEDFNRLANVSRLGITLCGSFTNREYWAETSPGILRSCATVCLSKTRMTFSAVSSRLE